MVTILEQLLEGLGYEKEADGLWYLWDSSNHELTIVNAESTELPIRVLRHGKVWSEVDSGGTVRIDATSMQRLVLGSNFSVSNEMFSTAAINGWINEEMLGGTDPQTDPGCTSLVEIYIRAVSGSYTDITIDSLGNSLVSLQRVYVERDGVIFYQNPFSDCVAFSAVNVSSSVTDLATENGVLYNKAKTTLLLYPRAKSNLTYNMPDTVTSIAVNAFMNATNLVGINIPDTVTAIGNSAYYGCTSVTTIQVGKNVASIGSYAFYRCQSCNRIQFFKTSGTTLTIGASAFALGTQANPAVAQVYSEENWAADVLDNYKNQYTTFEYVLEDPVSAPYGSTPVELYDEAIFMTDPENKETYVIYSGGDEDYNCVKSYSIFTGSEQPFEYVKMVISKKQLSVLAHDLVDRIYPGRNRVTLIGPGQGDYIVSSCKKSNDGWTVIAYSVAEQLRAIKLTAPISLGNGSSGVAPLDIITSLVYSNIGVYVLDPGYSTNPIQDVKYLFRASRNTWETETGMPQSCPMAFSAGTSIWYVIMVCAVKLGCKLWITGGALYLIDTSIDTRSEDWNISNTYRVYPSNLKFNDIDTVYLNRNGAFPYNMTEMQTRLLGNIVDLPAPGNEGPEVLRNTVTVEFNSGRDYRAANPDNQILVARGEVGEGTKKGTVVSDEGDANSLVYNSRRNYTEKSFTYQIPELGYYNAKEIANHTAEMYCDAETSISFEVRELIESEEERTFEEDGETVTRTVHVRTWYPTFDTLTRIHHIVDYSNDLTVSTKCNFEIGGGAPTLPAKGMLSYVEHKFPEHITKYTFGVSTPTDITQNNSIIKNTLYNG